MHFVSSLAGDSADRGEGEQRGSERSSGRAGGEAALPADPGGGAGESAQTGEPLHLKREAHMVVFGFKNNCAGEILTFGAVQTNLMPVRQYKHHNHDFKIWL